MDFKRVIITTNVPIEHADKVRQAVGKTGAGLIGEYSFCSFSNIGQGRFMPTDQANPHVGEAGKLETVEEEHIEVVCNRTEAKGIIRALRDAHPYEEVPISIIPLIDEEQL